MMQQDLKVISMSLSCSKVRWHVPLFVFGPDTDALVVVRPDADALAVVGSHADALAVESR